MAEYIEREAVTSEVYKLRMDAFRRNDRKECFCYNKVYSLLVNAPAADVAPVVHGRWEAQKYWKHENKHSIQYHTNRCSLCHCDVSSRLLYNYCPNCGARMDGE